MLLPRYEFKYIHIMNLLLFQVLHYEHPFCHENEEDHMESASYEDAIAGLKKLLRY